MPEIFKERIIKLLKHADYEPVKLAQLARTLGVSSEDYPQFKTAFDQLRQASHVVMGAGNLIALPPAPHPAVARPTPELTGGASSKPGRTAAVRPVQFLVGRPQHPGSSQFCTVRLCATPAGGSIVRLIEREKHVPHMCGLVGSE